MGTSIWRGGLLWIALLSSSFAVSPVWAESEADKARAIAERFATGKSRDAVPAGARRVVPAAKPEPAEESRISEEIDMLARARAEAEARREELVKAREAADRAEQDAARGHSTAKDAELRRTAEDRQRAEAALQAAEVRRKDEEARLAAEAQRKAEEARKVEEALLIAQAKRKAEEEARLAQERRRVEAARIAEDTKRKADEEKRLTDERNRADAARSAAETQRKAEEAHQAAQQTAQQTAMEAEREAEADRIAETLKKAREARTPRGQQDARATTSSGRDAVDETPRPRDAEQSFERAPPRSSDPYTLRRQDRPSHDAGNGEARHATRVAILLVLEPGNYGIRRNNKTADPLLCGEHGCYVSSGAEQPADHMGKRRALGFRRTLGQRAGACRNSLGCVFRDVDLVAYPAFVQPVDMHVLRHDRRQPQMLHEASDCRLAGERLHCSAIRGPDYTMWIVPEEMARRAGPAALERALEDGLPDAESPRPTFDRR